ncbi:MAG: cobalt-precorrin-6A reductase [Pseudanabaenaceae cyanobacterium SKYGB_i_bin29]|nr:cobalt-precorrin-6A reductase [Pseudanabaenaceae cyanobacterium SKYG29]MDW8421175.1 cobalt-precorrin-6A reductase [Pseudanabaenaceae cyanobacterium SKYGB_i_bin29]
MSLVFTLSLSSPAVWKCSKSKLLVLGGTGDAVKFVHQFVSLCPQVEVITSLAGRTAQPQNLQGTVRIGGFGGVLGLVDYLRQEKIDFVVDLTHPCAGQIKHHAFLACRLAQVPYLLFCRPPWLPTPADRWISVDRLEAVPAALPPTAQRVFITTGRQNLTPFLHLPHLWFLIRSVDPPTLEIPNSEVILDRGPFTLERELALLQEYRIDTIVTKNSGGDATYAKILAARQLHLPVVMVQRPPLPPAPVVSSLAAVLDQAVSFFHQDLQSSNPCLQ